MAATTRACQYPLLQFAAVVVHVLAVVLCQTADDSHDYPKRAEALNSWLKSHTQHLSPSLIEVAPTDDMGLGVVVSAAGAGRIRTGTRLFELSINATLCRDRLAMEGKAGYGAILTAADEEQMVVLSILTEHALGPLSPFAPWLAAVPTPREIQTPWQWPEEEQRMIEPRSVAQMVMGIKRSAQSGYDGAKRYMASLKAFVRQKKAAAAAAERGAVGSVDAADNEDATAWSFERYAWARNLVDTRAWNLQGKKFLVPVADFFNHDEDDHDKGYTYSKHVYSRSQKFLDYHSIALVRGMKIVRVMSDRVGGAAGTPLHESYGDNTNDIYFAYHGFLPSRNERDCQVLRVGRGLVPRDRSSVNSELLRMITNERGLQGGQYDIWSAPVCVHRGEFPPVLEIISWIVALGLTTDAPLRTMLTDCIISSWNRRTGGRVPQAGYEREDHLRRSMRLCLINDDANAPLGGAVDDARRRIVEASTTRSRLTFVNRTHRIQHVIVTGNAKEEFGTLKMDAEDRILLGPDSGSASPHRKMIMAFRKSRKEYLRGVLHMVRASQRDMTSAVSDTHGHNGAHDDEL